MGKAYAILYTVYFYEEDENHTFVLKHYNGFTFANSIAEACHEVEDEFPEAERIDIQAFDSCFEIPDDKMEFFKEILTA